MLHRFKVAIGFRGRQASNPKANPGWSSGYNFIMIGDQLVVNSVS